MTTRALVARTRGTRLVSAVGNLGKLWGSGAVARSPSPQGLRLFKLESMGNFPRSLAYVRANSAGSSLCVSFLLISLTAVEWVACPVCASVMSFEGNPSGYMSQSSLCLLINLGIRAKRREGFTDIGIVRRGGRPQGNVDITRTQHNNYPVGQKESTANSR